MKLKEKVENHPVVWLFGIAITSFLAGIGAYEGVLRIAKLDVVPEDSYLTKQEVDQSYVRVDSAGRLQDSASSKEVGKNAGRENDEPNPSVDGAISVPEEVAESSEIRTDEASPSGREVVEVNGVVFTNYGCTTSGGGLSCEVRMVSTEKDQAIAIQRAPLPNCSRIIDGEGDEHVPSRILFGNERSAESTVIRNVLVAGVPTKMTLGFSDLKNFQKSIALLELVWVRGVFKYDRVQFRRTPLN
jgi:hypothetical protein